MPRVTNADAATRKELVRSLWARGLSIAAIAKGAGCEWRTAKRDIVAIAHETVKELDAARELARLLLGGRAVEAAGWTRGDPALALAGQKQTLNVVLALRDLDTEARLQRLEEAMSLGAPLRSNGVHATGTGNGTPQRMPT